jgi:putative tricarboxylic transport membrane protein
MLISGLVGWFMNGQRIPVAPLLLGFILGETVEKQLRSGLIASSGNPTPFFTSPFFFAFVLIVLVSILTRKKPDLRRGS